MQEPAARRIVLPQHYAPTPTSNIRPPLRMDNVHVINLASRPDRWERLQRDMREKWGWDVTPQRHDAVDTRAWSPAEAPGTFERAFASYVHPSQLAVLERNYRINGWELQRGAVGCTLSHVALWNLLWSQRDHDYMVVLEDDAEWGMPGPVALPQVEQVLSSVPNDWDVLLLGCTRLELRATHALYSEINAFWCTHGYVVNKQAVPRLTRDLFPIFDPIEWEMSRRATRGELRIYALNGDLIKQNGVDSDINVSRPTGG